MKMTLVFACLACLSVRTFGSTTNDAANFVGNSDLQLETKSQCRELSKALKDIVGSSEKKLKTARYADFQGKKSRWSVVDIINHYLISPTGKLLTEKSFFNEMKTEEMKKSIRTLQTKLGDCDSFTGD